VFVLLVEKIYKNINSIGNENEIIEIDGSKFLQKIQQRPSCRRILDYWSCGKKRQKVNFAFLS